MAGRCLVRPRGWLSSPVWATRDGRRAAPDGRPITVDEGRAFIGRECRRARLARFVHGEVGLAEHVAHGLGPGFLVELDQALEFAQDMGVAEGVIDASSRR